MGALMSKDIKALVLYPRNVIGSIKILMVSLYQQLFYCITCCLLTSCWEMFVLEKCY